MHEIVANLHMHTRYSDGHGSHREIAEAALETGIDVVWVTDHNVWVQGQEGYYRDGPKQVLLLVGEEIHDQKRDPQKNHMLVLGAGAELAHLAEEPQRLIDGVREQKGLCFLAHPFDPAAPAFQEPDLSWVDWDVQGFTGLELWNALSEFKSRIKSRLHALYFLARPQQIARSAPPECLRRWDELLAAGARVVAIGGSDAHAFPRRLGPLKLTIFPYAFHFRTVNTHLLLETPFTGQIDQDRQLVMEALGAGRAFIGYDLPAPTRGFRFTAQGGDGQAWMGGEISARNGVTLQVRLPQRAPCRLLKDGEVKKAWNGRETCTHITSEPGVYRVEVSIRYLGMERAWIYSNPIYVR